MVIRNLSLWFRYTSGASQLLSLGTFFLIRFLGTVHSTIVCTPELHSTIISNGADAPRAGVREQFAVEQHHPADQIESEEHGQGQEKVDGHVLRGDLLAVRMYRRPSERELSRYRMDGTDDQLDHNLDQALPGHRYPPVLHAVVDGKQLEQRDINK
ncbi:hypothetical protein LSH36_19g09011 [Paralvinella palmiformis]|uniref:Uncharacterized protein n=1 Tax=Paralvinella palmiformis TaxID=53620 RepID=A0AAD9KD22_9ANNE|nr:hypothetical protein LSH36_19g09011 [Paralvinella palmiformis]